MPQVKISHVVSFSSEESNYPANNLLSSEIVNKRWVGQREETSNSVVLQLEKSVQISQIHIGNYHSAFIEILVGRSEANNQNYEVIVCANSFMSPSDSRNSENINRVKTFSGDQLSSDVKNKKWDRVRIVCTQPYNKHVQFGLSFIQIFTSESLLTALSKPVESSSQLSQLGRFRLRKSSSDEDDVGSSFKPGELFARQKRGLLSTDAEIRKAGKPEAINSTNKESSLLVKGARPIKTHVDSVIKHENEGVLSRKRDSLLYDEDDDKKHDKIDRIMQRDRQEKHKLNTSTTDKDRKKEIDRQDLDIPKVQNKTEKTTKESKAKSFDNNGSRDSGPSRQLKRQSSEEINSPSAKKQCDSKSKEDEALRKQLENIPRGSQCLRGITFVLSGYVNPKRSNLRDTAISLGARYAPDWAPHCTHLVCAFPNTPKYDQVKKASPDAAIVSAQWIEECGKEQACLPWKWYALDSSQKIRRPDRPLPKLQEKKPDSRNACPSTSSRSMAQDDSEGDTDDELEIAMKRIDKVKKLAASGNNEPTEQRNDVRTESGSDTDIDEEIVEKYKQLSDTVSNDQLKTTPIKKESDDDYVVSTQSVKNNSKSPCADSGMEEYLPDLFQFLKFYIDPNLDNIKYDVCEIKRYIIAYGGDIIDTWPDKKVDVAITHERFVSKLRFDGDKKCMYLRPEWVWKCNDTEMLHPYESYSIR